MDKDKFLRAWRDMANDLGDQNLSAKNGDEDFLATRMTFNKMMAIARQMEVNRPAEVQVFKLTDDLTYTIPLN